MRNRVIVALLMAVAMLPVSIPRATAADAIGIPAGSTVYIAPMDGFEPYLAAALRDKKVPVVIVAAREQADFEISGSAETAKPGVAKMVLFGQKGTDEQASIAVTNLRTSVVAFAHSVHKRDTSRGRKGAAEACAKKLKSHIEKRR